MTRGSPIGLSALLSYLNPRNGIFTGIASASRNETPVIGQVKCVEGRRSARLRFILPDDAAQASALPLLLDNLAVKSGEWGAMGLLAEVEEKSAFFESLRRVGYAVYGWQRIYQVPFTGAYHAEQANLWRFATPVDEIPIRQLFQSLVPPLAQAADPLPAGRLFGLVHRDKGQLLAYVESSYGPDGIFLRPLIHPEISHVSALISGMEGYLLPLLGRKVYLAVRSHQAWLENPITPITQLSSDRQALMVKYLSSTQRVLLNNKHRSVIEETGAEPSAPPMTRRISK